jgi:signal transduction histidine kinase
MAAAFDEMLDALESALADARASEQRSRRFLAEAAHQLRTPVAGIQASVEALPRARTRAEREQLLATMARESSRAGRRVAALLRMARLDQGERPPRRPADLVLLCREETARTASLAPRLEVTFGASGFWEPVSVDPDGVREALANLLDNARRHAVGRIDVGLARGGDGAVEVRVADDGPGLPDDDRQQPFEPFVTLDGHGGSGLGLAIARGIARAHDGDVTYEEGAFLLQLQVGGDHDGGSAPSPGSEPFVTSGAQAERPEAPLG